MCKEGIIPTLGVHEMDDLVERLHVETNMTLYDYDALFTDGIQRDLGAYTRLDSEWSSGCLTLIKMASDPGR